MTGRIPVLTFVFLGGKDVPWLYSGFGEGGWGVYSVGKAEVGDGFRKESGTVSGAGTFAAAVPRLVFRDLAMRNVFCVLVYIWDVMI